MILYFHHRLEHYNTSMPLINKIAGEYKLNLLARMGIHETLVNITRGVSPSLTIIPQEQLLYDVADFCNKLHDEIKEGGFDAMPQNRLIAIYTRKIHDIVFGVNELAEPSERFINSNHNLSFRRLQRALNENLLAKGKKGEPEGSFDLHCAIGAWYLQRNEPVQIQIGDLTPQYVGSDSYPIPVDLEKWLTENTK